MSKSKLILILVILLFISFVYYEVYYYEETYIKNDNLYLIEIRLEGAVKRPGKFRVTNQTTYRELFTYAGGLLEDSDISQLTLDDYIYHNYLYINFQSQKDDENDNDKTLYNLNTITYEQLIRLTYITENRANEIINYRNLVGRFHSVDELLKVKGIGAVTFENIKNYFIIE